MQLCRSTSPNPSPRDLPGRRASWWTGSSWLTATSAPRSAASPHRSRRQRLEAHRRPHRRRAPRAGDGVATMADLELPELSVENVALVAERRAARARQPRPGAGRRGRARRQHHRARAGGHGHRRDRSSSVRIWVDGALAFEGGERRRDSPQRTPDPMQRSSKPATPCAWCFTRPRYSIESRSGDAAAWSHPPSAGPRASTRPTSLSWRTVRRRGS